jgi:hypothetical protein
MIDKAEERRVLVAQRNCDVGRVPPRVWLQLVLLPWGHLGIPRDEVHDELGELWTLVFLQEMTSSNNGGVRLATSPGDALLEEAVDWQSAGIRA